MRKSSLIIGVLMLLAIIVLSFSLYKQQPFSSAKDLSSEVEVPSYESFVELNQSFFSLLNEEYKSIIQPINPVATVYSANEGGEWAEGEMDLMEGDDMARPLKQKYELINIKSGFYTQIVLTYSPQLTEKNYLNTTRIYGTENEDSRLPKETKIMDLAINTLSFPGTFIEILTTPIYGKKMNQTSDQQLKMVNENADITRTVQKFFNQQSSYVNSEKKN